MGAQVLMEPECVCALGTQRSELSQLTNIPAIRRRRHLARGTRSAHCPQAGWTRSGAGPAYWRPSGPGLATGCGPRFNNLPSPAGVMDSSWPSPDGVEEFA